MRPCRLSRFTFHMSRLGSTLMQEILEISGYSLRGTLMSWHRWQLEALLYMHTHLCSPNSYGKTPKESGNTWTPPLSIRVTTGSARLLSSPASTDCMSASGKTSFGTVTSFPWNVYEVNISRSFSSTDAFRKAYGMAARWQATATLLYLELTRRGHIFLLLRSC